MITKRQVLTLIILVAIGYWLNPERAFAQTPTPDPNDWYTTAANFKRESRTNAQVTGSLSVDWYRPIEAYIDQKTQVIAAQGKIYLATSRGLYVYNASDGAAVWKYDTEMPVYTPTVVNGVVYFGSFDKKVHALNASNGTQLWEFTGARAGFSASPVVANDKVYIGGRDGYFYALNTNNGSLAWQYPANGQNPLGPILISPAYDNNTLFFASQNMKAYALNATTGAKVWESATLPGSQYQSFWPVIYQNWVIFSASEDFRNGKRPGQASPLYSDQICDMYPELNCNPYPTSYGPYYLGPTVSPPSWAGGMTTYNAAPRVTEYFENHGYTLVDQNKYKPWRRPYAMINKSNGTEYTFDSDSDGYPEYLPAVYFGTGSGNDYPPIVGATGNLHFNSTLYASGDPKGTVFAWNPLNPTYVAMSGTGGFQIGATAEPQSISAGGNTFFRSVCCDRLADTFSLTGGGILWQYDLNAKAPGYNDVWTILDCGQPNLCGFYSGPNDSPNGLYHSHGDQNPFVTHQNKVFIHRGNSLIAFSASGGSRRLANQTITAKQDQAPAVSVDMLKSRLEFEVNKHVTAGHLRPGYYNVNQFMYDYISDYFNNPGDTLYTLSIAYPHITNSAANNNLKTRLKTFLDQEYQTYLQNNAYATSGWSTGQAREDMTFPPDIAPDFATFGPGFGTSGASYNYPPQNLYAMYVYAKYVLTGDATAQNNVYTRARTLLSNGTIPQSAPCLSGSQNVWEMNSWMAGYQGYLSLQALTSDTTLRSTIQNALANAKTCRWNNFSQNTPFTGTDEPSYHKRNMNIARNFLGLVPEIADAYAANINSQVNNALSDYNTIAPYWFVARYEAAQGESVMQSLYDYPALFQAKAWIQNESRENLYKYLDTPAFERGDLFYIQNLVATIEAPTSGPEPTPLPTPPPATDLDGDGDTDLRDLLQFLGFFGGTGQGDFNNSGRVDVFDFGILVGNFGR